MRIACPSCETAYDVPESVLTPGRVMRCARCRREWAPNPVTDDPPIETEAASAEPAVAVTPPPLSPPAPAPPDDDPLPFIRAPEAPMPPPRRAVPVAWGVSLVLLGFMVWSAIIWREPIMRHWPPSARLYLALGYARG